MNAKAKPDTPSRKPKLLDSVHVMLLTKHYARSAEKNYMQWIYRFIIKSVIRQRWYLEQSQPQGQAGKVPGDIRLQPRNGLR